MTIGEALAEARNKAGLSVDQVSKRTRIRETVIRGIEQDDYDACGGDLYIRGYVRVIASAVGIDAQPLIREYDLTHSGEPPTTIDPVPPGLRSAKPAPPEPLAPPAPPEPMAPMAPQPLTSEPPTLIDSIIPGLQSIEPTAQEPASATPGMITPELVASEPLTPEPQPPLVTAASRPPSAPGARPRSRSQGSPNKPAQPTWKARKRSRRWVAGIAALAVVVLAAVGFAGSRIASSLRNSAETTAGSAAAGSRGASASPGTGNGKSGVATKGSGTKATTNPATTPASNPPASAVSPPPSPLHVARAEAFGPNGAGDGDNPHSALSPITPGASSPWQTDWYTTAEFGQLKQGTGLLLDMGSPATITSVRIALGPAIGAGLQLRVGDTPALADLPVAASASDVGGTVSLHLAHATRAQYVLIWFTMLPPNSAGQYQASVYQVRVSGQP